MPGAALPPGRRRSASDSGSKSRMLRYPSSRGPEVVETPQARQWWVMVTCTVKKVR